MSKTIIAEGRTTNEAIEKGLKELGVSRDRVEITVLEDEKRSFFSILTPRVVKIENQEKAKKNVEEFLKDFIKNLPEGTNYTVESDESGLNVALFNDKLGFLIGYRGETLYALQIILSAVASKDVDQKIRVILDIEGYKQKRQKTLEDLAEKVARTVIRTRKSVTLEPMQPYERKIIHSKLQENPKVETTSIGEEPHRKVVISLKNK